MESIYDALIIRVTDEGAEELTDRVAAETAFTLVVNGEILVSLLCTPAELDNMAIGFLLSEGILVGRDALQAVEVDEKTSTVSVNINNLPEDWEKKLNKKTITSGCGKGITFTDANSLRGEPAQRAPLRVPVEKISVLLKEFRRVSDLFLKTGGVHSAALASLDGILFFSEDIGRHNAVDKLIGKAFMQDVGLADKILLSSGRISGEIMTKMVRNRIPILVSRAAPTCMAISYAEDYGITLIGFARGRRMNIYTHPQRVVLSHE